MDDGEKAGGEWNYLVTLNLLNFMSHKVEEAALVDNSHFCLMFYPVQLTNKYLVTLPLMEPDPEVLIVLSDYRTPHQ